MRQVPRYLIVGNGRVARHFSYYFNFLRLPYRQWARKNNTPEELADLCASSSHLLLLINDSAISSFLKEHPVALSVPFVIHFSGSLIFDDYFGAHPLMTFGDQFYPLRTYQQIPFIVEEGCPEFSKLLPGVPNEYFYISKELKPYYHALFVMSGNFTTILWQKMFKELKEKFGIKKKVAYPYLKQTMENLILKASDALTGPLARDEKTTIQADLNALEGDVYQEIYSVFLKVFAKAKGSTGK